MNNLQPYEKHIADELRNVPLPDPEQGWIEMRKLLDQDQDHPGGGASWSGNHKWWWMGLTVLLIIVGLIWREEFVKVEGQQDSSIASILRTKVGEDRPIKTEGLDQSNNQVEENTFIETVPDKNSQENGVNKTVSIPPSGFLNRSRQHESVENINIHKQGSKANEESDNFPVEKINEVAANKLSDHRLKREVNQNNKIKSLNDSEKNLGDSYLMLSSNKQERASEKSISPSIVSSKIYSDVKNPNVEVDAPQDVQSFLIIPGKTDKAFLKETRIKGMEKDNRKMSRRSMKGNSGEKVHELTFAAGLALPKSFAVSGQQAAGYGINGKTSTISDYLPVPYFQYHLNDKMFVQTELHFQSPQYTDRLLIYQKQNETSQSTRLEKNIFVEKLYYFNIPFNFYFSPARNFYIGSGIQYSSLLSGIASFQENRYAGSTLESSNSKVLRFKDDSVATKLSPSELRYQFDANYYVKRFTIGMRYNQAMKNFVDVQPANVLPYTQARNKAFLVYLRYNIWEERRKER